MPLGDIGTYESYGYRLAAATGALAATTAGDIFQFRWTSTTRKCRILEVRISAAEGATAFTAGDATISLFIARAFTASGTGGTALTPLGTGNKLRTSQNASLLGDARIATVTNLGAGTKALDTNPVGIIVCGITGTAGAQIINDTPIYDAELGSYTMPLVLANNEGIVVQCSALPATGTANVGVTVLWAEIDGGSFTTE